MSDYLRDVDPGDETHAGSGLCAWHGCADAALPNFDFCKDHEGDVENIRLEALREKQIDELVREVKERERWHETMARLYDPEAA